MLSGATIDTTVVGGPAHNSRQFGRGDVIVKVDGVPVTSFNVQEAIIGRDMPGSPVVVSVAKGGLKVT